MFSAYSGHSQLPGPQGEGVGFLTVWDLLSCVHPGWCEMSHAQALPTQGPCGGREALPWSRPSPRPPASHPTEAQQARTGPTLQSGSFYLPELRPGHLASWNPPVHSHMPSLLRKALELQIATDPWPVKSPHPWSTTQPGPTAHHVLPPWPPSWLCPVRGRALSLLPQLMFPWFCLACGAHRLSPDCFVVFPGGPSKS